MAERRGNSQPAPNVPTDDALPPVTGGDSLSGATEPAAGPARVSVFERWLGLVFRTLTMIAIGTQLVIVLIDVVGRNLADYYIISTEDIGRIAVMTVGLLGAGVAWIEDEHVTIHALPERSSGWWTSLQSFRVLLVGGFSLFGLLAGIRLTRQNWHNQIATLPVPQGLMDIPLIVGFGVIVLSCLARLRFINPWRTGAAVVAVVVLYFAATAARSQFIDPSGAGAIALLLVTTALLMILGVPLAFSLLLGALTFVFVTNVTTSDVAITNTASGISNFILLSVPFFIATGMIMSGAGISTRLSEAMTYVIGRVKGGLWDVVIVSMFVFSGISGSKVADTAGVGASMAPMLRRQNYDLDESSAVLAAAAAAGETIPPSVVLIVLGTVSSMSISALFAAGVIPAALISIGLSIVVHIRNRKRAKAAIRPAARPSLSMILTTVASLCIPVVLVGGIILGIGTPTEVAGVSTLLSMAVGMCITKNRSVLFGHMRGLASLGGSVLFLIGSAAAFAYVLSIAQIPEQVTSFLTDLHVGKFGFIVITAIILMIFGGLLEGMPAILIFAPILMPMAAQLHINQVQYGICFLVALGTGCVIPPIGIVINVACKVVGGRVGATFRAMVVYATWLMVSAVVIGMVPWISLELPRLLNINVGP